MKTPPPLQTAAAALLPLLLLLCAAAPPPAFAQTSPTETFAFAAVGATTPLSNFDALTVAAESDGTRTFQLDLIYQTSSAPIAGITAFMNFLEEDFEIVEISNVLIAAFVMPNPATGLVVAGREETLDGVRYAKAYELNWAAITSLLGVPLADTYVRLLTATIKLKKTAGDTTVNFSGNPGKDIVGTELTIQGPPLARAGVSPENMMETDAATTAAVTCALSRPALADTACTLAIGAGDATDPADYSVSPALAGATITIPKGETSASKDFTITPNLAGDGGTIEIELANVVAAGEQVVRDPQPALFEIIAPDLVVSPLRDPIDERGRTRGIKMKLRTQPRSGNVVVDLSSSDTGEATVRPAKLTYTAANWNRDQNVFIEGVNDLYDDGDQPFTLTFAVNATETDDDNYHGVVQTLDAVNVDTERNVRLQASATPLVLSEQGGAQDVEITVRLMGHRLGVAGLYPVQVETDTAVALALGTGTYAGTATSPADFAISLPPFTIPAGQDSLTKTVSITPVDDGASDNNETIVLTATLEPYAAVPLILHLRDYRLNTTALSGETTEAGATATFTLSLPTAPEGGDVIVNAASSDTGEATLSPSRLTFTAANFDKPQTITVTGINDTFDDGDVEYTVNLSVDAATPDPNYRVLTKSLPGKTTDDDTAKIRVTASPAFLTEDTAGAQTVTFTAELLGDARLETPAQIALAFKTGSGAGTAVAGTDYTQFAPPTITIPAGQKTGSVSAAITTTADAIDDSNETIVLTATLSPYEIADLELPIREFALNPSEITGNTGEDRSTAHFTLTLPTRPISGEVVVDVTSSDPGEAAVSPPALTFTADNWNQARRVVVTGVDDNFDDGDQPYTINLAINDAQTADPNYHGRTAELSGTNTDDDTAAIALRAAPDFLSESAGAQPITLTAALTGAVRLETDAVITLTRSGTATPGTDYTAFTPPANITIPARAAAAAATFAITPLAAANDGETIVFSGALSGYTIPDATIAIREFGYAIAAPVGQPTEEGATATISVQLISAPSANVVINVASSDSTEASVSPSKLTFTTANWNQPQTVTITGANDNFDDGEVPYNITFTADNAATADANYDDLAESVPLTTTDDDEVQIAISISSPEFLVENNTLQNLRVNANFVGDARLEQDAEITLRDGGGTATPVSDYRGLTLPRTITIPAGASATSTSFQITPIADRLRDNAETIIVAASASADPEIAAAQVRIREFALYASAFSGGGAVGENGDTATFTLELPNAPASGQVVITFTSSDPGEATVTPRSMTFTTADWNTPQTATVRGVNDNYDDGDQPYTITAAVRDDQTADINYRRKIARVSGVNADDDTAQITLRATPAFLIEEDGEQQFTLTAALAGQIRFDKNTEIILSDRTAPDGRGNAAAGADYVAFTPPTITIPADAASASASLAITATADQARDNNELIVIAAALPGNAIDSLLLPIREYTLRPGALSGAPTESGGVASFTLTLPTAPTGNVAITISNSDPSEASISPASLAFTAANWRAPQTITITGADDNFDDGDRAYTLTLATDDSNTADPAYHGREAQISATTADDDTAEITLRATPEFLVESAGAQPVTITASLGEILLEQDARITLAAGAGNATAGTDYETFTLPPAITIPARAAAGIATFAVTPLDDTEIDSDETIVITAAFSPYTIADLDLQILGFELDVDASGAISPQDGIMTARRLLGAPGNLVIRRQTAAAADAVAANIDLGTRTRELDVNADGAVNAADGILITRWLLGLRGDELVAGFADASAAVVRDNMAKFGR